MMAIESGPRRRRDEGYGLMAARNAASVECVQACVRPALAQGIEATDTMLEEP